VLTLSGCTPSDTPALLASDVELDEHGHVAAFNHARKNADAAGASVSVAAGDLGENITTRHVHLAGLDARAVLEVGFRARIGSQDFVRPA